MKKARKEIIVLSVAITGLLVMLFILNGCGWEPLTLFPDREGQTGSLILEVNEPMSPLVLLPGGDNVVSYYTITVSPTTLPDPPSVQTVSAPPPPEGVLFENLKEDTYNIDIGGYTVGDELITQGTDVIFIAANTQETTTIQMEILPGTGDVAIDLTITPPDLVPYDNVVGQWYDGSSWTPSSWVQASAGVWDLDRTADAGYHLMTWELFSEGYESIKVAGAAEAVYVRANRTTSGLYDLDESNIGEAIQTGAAIVIIWEAPSPIITMFTDGIDEVAPDEVFTLTTVTDADPLDTHAWYLDGVLVSGEDAADITYTAPSEETILNFSKVGFKGDIITSASKIVVIAIPPPELGGATWTAPATDVFIPGDSDYAVSCNVTDGVDPLPDGHTIYWRLDPTSDPEVLTWCSLQYSSTTVSGGSISNMILNGSNLAPNDFPGRVQISESSDFSTYISTSPTITWGNY